MVNNIIEIKAELTRVNSQKEKLQDKERDLRKTIQELEDQYASIREKFLSEDIPKIKEKCGWTHGELLEALGGKQAYEGPSNPVNRVSKGRTYLELMVPNAADHIRVTLTPRLGEYDQAYVDEHGLITLLKYTIDRSTEPDVIARATTRLKQEEKKLAKAGSAQAS